MCHPAHWAHLAGDGITSQHAHAHFAILGQGPATPTCSCRGRADEARSAAQGLSVLCHTGQREGCQTTHFTRGSPPPLQLPFTRAGRGSRCAHRHAPWRHACIASCPKGSRAASPTAALPGGRPSLLLCTYHCPKGSRAGAPTAALPGGRAVLLPCTIHCPKGSRAATPTAALPGGRQTLLPCTSNCPKGSRAGEPTAALQGGRTALQTCK